ncbi:MAG: cytochrome c [Gammaproteobacteria bacterium]|nr:cytochrome c [Gammaproteobacteria bacterium]
MRAGLERGKLVFSWECKGCHGKNAVARFGGSVPDLRYATTKTHEEWHGIVVGGARQMNGMPRFELSIDDSEALRQYVLSRSYQLRESR